MAPLTQRGSVVYRLNETLIDADNSLLFEKGDILSHDTMSSLIDAGWYEIEVTIIVLQ